MANGIELILADHQRISQLFEEFRRTTDATAVGQVLQELNDHDAAEHAALYPFSVALLGNPRVLHRFDLAHAEIKRCSERVRDQEGEALGRAMELLAQTVTDHVADEEKNLLAPLQKKASSDQLQALATRIDQNKQRVG